MQSYAAKERKSPWRHFTSARDISFLTAAKKRSDKIQEIMQKESALIKEALKDQEDFPIRELFDDYLNTLQKVRSGEIEFRGRKPNGYAALLGEIQKAQKKALKTIHEKRLKKF